MAASTIYSSSSFKGTGTSRTSDTSRPSKAARPSEVVPAVTGTSSTSRRSSKAARRSEALQATNSEAVQPAKRDSSSKAVMPSAAVQAVMGWSSKEAAKSRRRPSEAESPSKRARTTVKDSGSEMLFMIYSGLEFTINAVDKNGALIPSFCIKAPFKSMPSSMGLIVIGSDLHMFGGVCEPDWRYTLSMWSLDTYTLDLRKIPDALEHGHNLLDLVVRHPHKMIDQKISPAVYLVGNYFYVLSITIDSSQTGFEYRHCKPDSAWIALENPPVHVSPGEKNRFAIESHALAGDTSIVISLMQDRGVYVFSIKSRTWKSVELETGPLRFIGQPLLLPDGIYISPSKTTLRVFDDLMSAPLRKLRIRGTSHCIRHSTKHQVAIMGDVTFIIRCGYSIRKEHGRPVYITIDTYKMSRGRDQITAMLHPPALLLEDEHPPGALCWLYCVPVRLSGFTDPKTI